jgi:hypothetical protein
MGPEKVRWRSTCSPSANATEPILPEVSTASASGFLSIGYFLVKNIRGFLFFLKGLFWP